MQTRHAETGERTKHSNKMIWWHTNATDIIMRSNPQYFPHLSSSTTLRVESFGLIPQYNMKMIGEMSIIVLTVQPYHHSKKTSDGQHCQPCHSLSTIYIYRCPSMKWINYWDWLMLRVQVINEWSIKPKAAAIISPNWNPVKPRWQKMHR